VQNKVHTLSLQRPHDFMNSPYEHLKGTFPSKRMHSMPKTNSCVLIRTKAVRGGLRALHICKCHGTAVYEDNGVVSHRAKGRDRALPH